MLVSERKEGWKGEKGKKKGSVKGGVTKKTAKTTKKRGRGKKKVNAGPKKAKTAYLYFTMAKRAEVQADNPKLKFGPIAKKLGEMWRELSEEEKAPYLAQAAGDKKRYESEKTKFDAGGDDNEGSDEESEGEDKEDKEDKEEEKDDKDDKEDKESESESDD